MPMKRGTAQATPGTLRTRSTSICRIGITSFACSTFASTTQTGAPMFLTVAVVHIISPQNTEICWHISSEQNDRPQTSIAYFARSRKSIFKAIPSMIRNT